MSTVILLGIWWILNVAETLIRRDAVELLATHLESVSGALGSLLGLQLLLSIAALTTLGLSIRTMFLHRAGAFSCGCIPDDRRIDDLGHCA